MCSRCGGSGYIPKWSHIANGVCFKCGGSNTTRTLTTSQYETIRPQKRDDEVARTERLQKLMDELFN